MTGIAVSLEAAVADSLVAHHVSYEQQTKRSRMLHSMLLPGIGQRMLLKNGIRLGVNKFSNLIFYNYIK
jgi:hypothetical protein